MGFNNKIKKKIVKIKKGYIRCIHVDQAIKLLKLYKYN